MLIGNKYDLVEINPDLREITDVDVGKFCKKEYLMFSEVSAKTGYNVRESFENFIESKNIEEYLLMVSKRSIRRTRRRRKTLNHIKNL